MSGAVQIVTAPTWAPVSVAEAKEQSRVTNTAEDPLIQQIIAAAAAYTEDRLNRALLSTVYDWTLDGFFSPVLRVPRSPLVSVDSINYIDQDGVTQLLAVADYQVDTASTPGRIAPAFDKVWPVTRLETFNTVTIQFTAGGGDPTKIPKPIRQGILMLVDHWFEHRTAGSEITINETPLGYDALVLPYKVH